MLAKLSTFALVGIDAAPVEAEMHDCRHDGPHVRGCWVVDLVLAKE